MPFTGSSSSNEGAQIQGGKQNRDRSLGRIDRKKVLGTSKVEYASQGLSVNHTFGCYHGCRYCYAMENAVEYKSVESYEEWANQVKIVTNVVEKVRDELSRKRKLPERIHMSFSGDPFMWDSVNRITVAEIADVTVELIRVINDAGIYVTVLTKGIYPELPLDELDDRNQYGITLTSFNEAYRGQWEPGSPPPQDRVEALRALSDRGARTWVSVEPYPTPEMAVDAGDVVSLLDKIEFVDKVIFGKMNYDDQADAYDRNVDPTFYPRVASEVRAWCAERGKPLHVKRGTPLHTPDMVDILNVVAEG